MWAEISALYVVTFFYLVGLPVVLCWSSKWGCGCNTCTATASTVLSSYLVNKRNMGARSNDIAFKVSLRMVKERDNSDVFFKVDGERFKENKTLKFHIDCSYKLTLEFRPGIQLRWGQNLEPPVPFRIHTQICLDTGLFTLDHNFTMAVHSCAHNKSI